MKQCLLAIRDMRDCNGECGVYGFITTGEAWQLVIYDGVIWQLSGEMKLVFPWMWRDQDKETWKKENSIIVDCIYMALWNNK